MEILNQFGFDPALFLAQIVNFLILAYVFKKFLYKPILKLLKERKDSIKQGLEDAENAHLALEKANEEQDEVLKRAGIEAEKIIESTRVVASELKSTILKEAEAESNRILKEAKEQATLEMEKMQGKISSMSLDLSQKILDKVLGSMFSEQEKKEIMKKGIEKISKIKAN